MSNTGRANNKALGLAGQDEILIGHLYDLIQSWSNIAEIAQKMTAILSSVSGSPERW